MVATFFAPVTTVILLVLVMILVECRGPHHPRGEKVAKHHVHYRPTRDAEQKLTQDTELLHDTEHIQEHLDSIAEPDLSNLTDEEIEFYYFQVHDTDKNSKLDGLEILQAILHTKHHPHKEGDPQEDSASEESDDIEYYTELIDRVLKEDDKNDDGYLSYAEYVEGRKKEQKQEEERTVEETTPEQPVVSMLT